MYRQSIISSKSLIQTQGPQLFYKEEVKQVGLTADEQKVTEIEKMQSELEAMLQRMEMTDPVQLLTASKMSRLNVDLDMM